MEWTVNYIMSQILTVIKYAVLGKTYHEKNRKRIIILNIATNALTIGIFILLKAWSGLATTIVTFMASIVFMIDEKKYGKKEKNDINDIIILIDLFVLFMVCSIITYQGVLSMFSIMAGTVWIYSVWQKKPILYKLLGVVTGALWLSYNIYIMSILGIFFEVIMVITSISGYVLEKKKTKKSNNSKEE